MKAHIITGNNIDVLKTYPDNHFDSVVTDPPYGIDFLGKTWDANTGALETYQQCLRVLKPGGYLLAFSAARTYHHLAVTVEQAGFEIRDQIMWIYSSGFPKSQDIGRQLHKKEHGRPDKQRFDRSEMEPHSSPGGGSNGFARLAFGEKEPAKNAQTTLWRHKENGKIYKALPDINGDRLATSHEGTSYGTVYEEVIEVDNEWSGWGTCLKPAHEPIVMARKPTKLSFAENVQQWGMGAVNIDAGRVPYATDKDMPGSNNVGNDGNTFGNFNPEKTDKDLSVDGGWNPNDTGRFPSNVIGEIEEAYQKYFYCPKVGRAERHTGFDLSTVPVNEFNDPAKVKDHPLWDESIGSSVSRLQDKIRKTNPPGNNHPTVKPIELMKYLIRLVTPEGGHILDPFNGSGSTGCAAVELDYEYTGIELDPKYAAIAQQRIQAWYEQTHTTTFGQLFE